MCAPASSIIRYLHVLQPEGAAVTGRRCSAPAVSSSVAHPAPDRRGSQPAVLQAQTMSGQQSCQSQSFSLHVSNRQHNAGQHAKKRPQGVWFFFFFSLRRTLVLTHPFFTDWLSSQIQSLFSVLIYIWSRTQKNLRYLARNAFTSKCLQFS